MVLPISLLLLYIKLRYMYKFKLWLGFNAMSTAENLKYIILDKPRQFKVEGKCTTMCFRNKRTVFEKRDST